MNATILSLCSLEETWTIDKIEYCERKNILVKTGITLMKFLQTLCQAIFAEESFCFDLEWKEQTYLPLWRSKRKIQDEPTDNMESE